MLGILAVLLARLLLVGLFLPFSAVDKIVNYGAAVTQAQQAIHIGARFLIAAGFCLEVLTSAAILTGMMDRLAALVLALYCLVTALLWKQFWKIPGFSLRGQDVNRDLFWDFLKNLALAGGLLLFAFGSNAGGATAFFERPFQSSHPYGSART